MSSSGPPPPRPSQVTVLCRTVLVSGSVSEKPVSEERQTDDILRQISQLQLQKDWKWTGREGGGGFERLGGARRVVVER